ncbi:unnamed protein product [Thlaspi arvense]|uniref:Uncharacterized protein n=1 Tax=Thlaspi arvense TaxID=13288 RepID=A0AAU9SSW7_THLAR|nr:unnamed protein product [Thlaspi arvense]
MGRSPCCEKKNGLKKGPWTPEEDQKLIDYINKNGYGNWRTLPKNAGSWSAIAARLPGRTDNEIKNYWNTHIRKRLLKMGIDPVTHSPRLDLLDISSILSSSLYSSSSHHHLQQHMNMSRLMMGDGHHQQLVNPEILKLATSLFSTSQQHHQNQNHTTQENQTDINQYQSGYNMIGNQELQSCFPNMDQFAEFQGFVPTKTVQDSMPSYPSYHDDDYSKSNFVLEPYYSDFASVLTTPSSSPTPLNSNSTSYINSSTCSTEDEKDYCSNNLMSTSEIPDYSFDVNGFLQFQETKKPLGQSYLTKYCIR